MATRRKRELQPSRLRPTFMDSAVLALVPVLIIGMVISLLYFLVLAFYRGDFDVRLMYLLTLFSGATVLIALIAIESGRAHANLFSIPLGLAAYVAICRFVNPTGPLAPLSWLINLALLGFAWWLADRITFDCAVFDSREPGSRQGLLQSLGILKKPDALSRKPKAVVRTNAYGKVTKAKTKKHNQGVWVLYFALLALPLFGLGQMVLPPESSSSGFTALIIYLGCSMSLLTSTSFLSMRRYVRHKGLEMPGELSRSWLGSAILAVCILLVVCLVLPLPGRNMGLFELPLAESPDDLMTSRWGWGDEGEEEEGGKPTSQKEDPNQGAANGGKSEETSGESKDAQKQASGGQEKGKSDGSQDRSGSDRESSRTEQEPSQSDQTGSPQDRPRDDSETSRNETSGDQSNREKPNTADGERQADSPKDDGDSSASDAETPENETGSDAPSGKSSNEGQAKDTGRNSRSTPSSSLPRFAMPSGLGQLFKWLTLIILILVIVGYAITHPEEIRLLWQRLKQLLAGIFGGSVAAEQTPEEPNTQASPQERLKPFAEYENPFRSSGQWTPEQIVKHTYAALQAWGAERDAKCQPEWTASEYARELANQIPEMAKQSNLVAKLFDRVMFGGWSPKQQDAKQLERLWEIMSHARN